MMYGRALLVQHRHCLYEAQQEAEDDLDRVIRGKFAEEVSLLPDDPQDISPNLVQ